VHVITFGGLRKQLNNEQGVLEQSELLHLKLQPVEIAEQFPSIEQSKYDAHMSHLHDIIQPRA